MADLIRVPFQLNYDQIIGVNDNGERWTLRIQLVVPIHLNQKISFQGGIRYWLETPDSGPEGTVFRFSVTFLSPK